MIDSFLNQFSKQSNFDYIIKRTKIHTLSDYRLEAIGPLSKRRLIEVVLINNFTKYI